MLPPKLVNTRKIAMCAELGFGPHEVIEGTFDESGFTVLGVFPDKGAILMSGHEQVKTRISWPDRATGKRAVVAMNDDFAEMFGVPVDHLPRRT